MQRSLLHGLSLLGIQLLGGCAPTSNFDADANRCRSQATGSPRSAGADFRLPEAVDETVGARVPPAPQDTSGYALCMRSRGWKLDPDGRALDKGPSAQEYSKVVADDLMICVHGSGDETVSKHQSSEAAGSSAARAVCACLEGRATPGITSVDLSLVIGEGGTIRRVTALPDSPAATCLRESLPGTTVAQPPSVPWKVAVRILHYQ
ncbi:MAG TPA: hypothetical protein VK714_20950 [Myxococcota bacterium]|nr:hypothetical protein [Myxococcota bacterium]